MEYKLAPSPIRASYLGSQKLNPSERLTYVKKIVRLIQIPTTPFSNNVAQTSFFDIGDSDDFVFFGGVSVARSATSLNTALLFPPNFFQLGDIMRGMITGVIGSNLVSADVRFGMLRLQENWGSGAPSTAESLILRTDLNVGENDLSDYFVEFYQQIRLDTNGNTEAAKFGRLTYTNANSIEGVSQQLSYIGSSNTVDLSTALATNFTVQWDTASASNSLNFREFWIEVF